MDVKVNQEEKSARVIVPDYQLSLAIGKEGQNARLAAKLTGYKIDIKSESQAAELEEELDFDDDFDMDDSFEDGTDFEEADYEDGNDFNASEYDENDSVAEEPMEE